MIKFYCLLPALFFLAVQLVNAQAANRNDVVIDEIMADPSPPTGLPAVEWLELKNTSSQSINLYGWRVGKVTAQSGAMPNFILQPDSFVIICSSASAATMATFGATLSVTAFPSLNNDEDLIYIQSADIKLIHAVNYTDDWYKNELKKGGGWTLEMTDTKNPCSGLSNWNAATDNKGGTPGKVNSTDAISADEAPPRLLRAFAPDSVSISLIFDEPLDSLMATLPANYTVSNGIGSPALVTATPPLFNKIELKLTAALANQEVYTITARSVTDCSGNEINTYNTAKAGLVTPADSLDVVVNEILFNPGATGVDYVEIYNRSTKIVDCKNLYLANRNSTGVISSIQQVSAESHLIFPLSFLVLTADVTVVQQNYLASDPGAFLQLPVMPSFPDDKGVAILLNAQGKIVDELIYSDKWHFQLVTNTEGVSLERIDYNAASVQENFHSAATSAGYGTPGYKNSQFRPDAQGPGELAVTPEIFSPDNDGLDDFATLEYNFNKPGYIANITIFDAAGRPVRYLQRNALCGTKGNFRWDGLDDKRQKLPQGIYILFTEIFNTAGQKKQFKSAVVLARK